jgi:membrane protease YdiL (CAAX protease family)
LPASPKSKEKDCASTIASRRRSLLKFFLLVLALSLPFWLVGAVTGLQLLPGIPVSSLMVLSPVTAGLILVYRENGTAGVTELLKRSFDFPRIRAKVWYAPIVLLMPGVMLLSWELMHLMGSPLPAPQFPILAALAMLAAFFGAALAEELGWSGYALDQMQIRWNALQASILLGVVLAAWHIVPLVQAHRSPAWITWQCLNIVATRVLYVWLYNNNGKSVFAAALFHTMQNISWMLFPNYGSHYDPRIAGLVTVFVAASVTVVWGPRTLARCRNV